MILRRESAVVLVLALVAIWPARCLAGVVVLCNRTTSEVAFDVALTDTTTRPYRLPPRDVASIPVKEKVVVAFGPADDRRRYQLTANAAYYFTARDDALDLIQASFPAIDGQDANQTPPPPAVQLDTVTSIPVMILVDDDERMARAVWEKQLRARVAAASDIFERLCRVRFEVVASGTWVTDNTTDDFGELLREFENRVIPAPARLAIGFTSQIDDGGPKSVHLGGTRGPLRSHVLIRRWRHRVSQTEQLEVLVHELGHFLGASHSGQYDSSMRRSFGDHRSNARQFHVGFDAVNVLIMNQFVEAVRVRKIRHPHEMVPGRKALLRQLYHALALTTPDDDTSEKLAALLSTETLPQQELCEPPESLIDATRTVVEAVAVAARENQKRSRGATESPLSGDRLTEFYVRRAAASAAELPSEHGPKAFLLGLAIALDRSTRLPEMPLVGPFCQSVESPESRRGRLAVLGTPSMRGRYDLTQHFIVSAGLTSLLGRLVAEKAGLAKELSDSRGGSGFSFADLAADMAGETFTSALLGDRLTLSDLAESYTVADFMPSVEGLKEGIPWADFRLQYGSAHDDRFYQAQAAIARRISALPGYQRRAGD